MCESPGNPLKEKKIWLYYKKLKKEELWKSVFKSMNDWILLSKERAMQQLNRGCSRDGRDWGLWVLGRPTLQHWGLWRTEGSENWEWSWWEVMRAWCQAVEVEKKRMIEETQQWWNDEWWLTEDEEKGGVVNDSKHWSWMFKWMAVSWYEMQEGEVFEK